MSLSMDKFVDLTVRRHGKVHFFSFSVHFNQARDLTCANIVKMMTGFDPISIPDIFR
jgi:hypothetical protein